MRTIDAKVDERGTRAAALTKAGTRVKSVNGQICSTGDTQTQRSVRLIELRFGNPDGESAEVQSFFRTGTHASG